MAVDNRTAHVRVGRTCQLRLMLAWRLHDATDGREVLRAQIRSAGRDEARRKSIRPITSQSDLAPTDERTCTQHSSVI